MVVRWDATEEVAAEIVSRYNKGQSSTQIIREMALPFKHHKAIFRTLKDNGVKPRSASGYGFSVTQCVACGFEFDTQVRSKTTQLCVTCAPTPRWRVRYARFGLTKPTFEAKLAEQHGLCAICEQELPANFSDIKIDHCHETGKVRDLLCNGCNVGLGYIEKPGFVTKALAYRAKHDIALARECLRAYNEPLTQPDTPGETQ